MKFRLNINVTEQDYLDYNYFWLLKSHYGKKQLMSTRIMLAVILGLAAVAIVLITGFNSASAFSIGLLMVWLVIMELLLPKFTASQTKATIKRLKKKGKMAYSPKAVMEFYEDYFTEDCEIAKTEQKYRAIERVSIVENKVVYIHVNNLNAYIVPLSAFESEAECREFLDFIKTKAPVSDVY